MEQQSTNDLPIGDLVKQLSEQTATLVRKEMQLAQLELQEKGKQAGLGAGLFGGAGAIALYGLGSLIAAVVLALATAIEPWLAALIVGVLLLAGAGVAGLMGKKRVEQAVPAAPVQSTRRDVNEIKGRAGR